MVNSIRRKTLAYVKMESARRRCDCLWKRKVESVRIQKRFEWMVSVTFAPLSLVKLHEKKGWLRVTKGAVVYQLRTEAPADSVACSLADKKRAWGRGAFFGGYVRADWKTGIALRHWGTHLFAKYWVKMNLSTIKSTRAVYTGESFYQLVQSSLIRTIADWGRWCVPAPYGEQRTTVLFVCFARKPLHYFGVAATLCIRHL